MTPEEIADRVAAIDTEGRYWWRGPDGTVYATDEYLPTLEGTDHEYLLYASPNWVVQWGGNWQAASDALAEIAELAKQSE